MSSKVINHKKVYKNNKILVLKTILLNKKNLSRAEISRKLQLNKSSVSRIINEFIKKKIIYEYKRGDSTKKGGKKPVLIDITKSNTLLGIYIDKYSFRYIVTDLKGNKLTDGIYKPDFKNNILFNIMDFFKYIKKNVQLKSVIGGCMVIPGVLNPDKKLIIYSGSLNVSDINLNPILNKYFHFPFFIENDSNAAAIAYKYFENDNYSDYIFILIRIDKIENVIYIGSGVVLHNKIVRGANNYTGEFLNNIEGLENKRKIYFINSDIWKIDDDYLDMIIDKIVNYIFFLNPSALIICNNILENDGTFIKKLEKSIKRILHVYKGFSIDIRISQMKEPEITGAIGVLIDKIFNGNIEII